MNLFSQKMLSILKHLRYTRLLNSSEAIELTNSIVLRTIGVDTFNRTVT